MFNVLHYYIASNFSDLSDFIKFLIKHKYFKFKTVKYNILNDEIVFFISSFNNHSIYINCV